MDKTLFFLVTEQTFNPGAEDEFVGYEINGKKFNKNLFIPVATHNAKAVVMYRTGSSKQIAFGQAAPEYLGDQYQKMILDSLLGFTNATIAKKCMMVEYTVPDSDPPERTRSSVYDWEQAGFPGQGTHRFHKAVKVLGVEVE